MDIVTLPKDPWSPILLLDAGYMTFYRQSATERFLQNQPAEKQPQDENARMSLLVDHLHKQMAKLLKKFEIPRGHVYTMRDCPHCENWRLDLYSEYKATRNKASDFHRLFANRMEEELRAYGPTLRVARMEADDLIALTVRRIRSLRPTQPLIILANDRDYLQLHKYGNLMLVDASMKEIVSGTPGQDGAIIELWKKVLMGDSSDNIPPIAKGVGPKTALSLAQDETARTAFVASKQCSAQLQRNRELIDMDLIPTQYCELFDQARCYQLPCSP